ncbi:peptidylprolyl isomerase [Plantactinospora sonchi]|uniref:Peptidylprolyl isomerase n=1 Tax=Plantactinospora sonchi TaxID=1544735 RepID=A0ABU7RN15_9ACTN
MSQPPVEPPQHGPTSPAGAGQSWQPGPSGATGPGQPGAWQLGQPGHSAQPGAAAAAYPTGAPPAKQNRRGLMIGLIVAGVVALLCVGAGCIGFGTYYWSEVRVEPTSDAPPPAQPLSCQATTVQGQPEIKAVGMPDFASAPQTGTVTMRITTSLGPISITMDRAKTPCTAASFQHLADKKFFDGSRCHRLVTEGIFVLQCGDPTGTGRGGPDYRFADENLTGAKYTRGVVAMANIGEPATNGSQFFIIFKDTELPAQYTPFGTVTAGLDIVEQVAAGGHDNSLGEVGGGTPNTPVTIQTLTVG